MTGPGKTLLESFLPAILTAPDAKGKIHNGQSRQSGNRDRKPSNQQRLPQLHQHKQGRTLGQEPRISKMLVKRRWVHERVMRDVITREDIKIRRNVVMNEAYLA